MKVLHVYRTYFPDSQGGLEEVIRQICLATRDHGVTSKVFTLSDEPFPHTLPRVEAEVVLYPSMPSITLQRDQFKNN